MASGKPERTDLYGHPGPEPAPRIDVVVPLKRSRSSRRRRSGARRDKLQPQRPVVLVVEDDAFAAKLIVKALEKQSFDVAHASNAPGALALLRRVKPMAIFMDVNLPGMDGVALAEWLKASPTHSPTPVIMPTSDARRETIARSLNAGIAGFIVKPFTREGLRQARAIRALRHGTFQPTRRHEGLAPPVGGWRVPCSNRRTPPNP